MSVAGFEEVLQGPFAKYLVVSQQIGGDVATHSALVERAFQAQLQHLIIASERKPPSETEQIGLFQPTSQYIGAIQEFREHHRTFPYDNHLFAISESIPALGWVTVRPAPSPYINEMKDVGQYYTNRVLNDWKEKDKRHVDWVEAWVQTLKDLETFVKEYHATGLVWSDTNAAEVSMGVPLRPPICPPPPPAILGDGAQMNPWENITKNLKKVTSDMQKLRTRSVVVKATQTVQQSGRKSVPIAPVDNPPVFARDGKKWFIAYQYGNNDLLVENAQMNNVVYLNQCADSTLEVKGKINSITVDSCKNTAIILDSVVSCVEFINCQSVKMQVFGCVPSISIDKTDGCQIYLSRESLAVEITSSKSSEINVLVPKGNGDLTEYPVPEQYKTTVSITGLKTIPVEFKG